MFELNIGYGCLPTDETILLNIDLKSSVQDKIDAINSLANCVVENEGFIAITRQTEILSTKGTKESFSYKTFITYLPKVSDGFSVGLSKCLCKSDGTSMLHFSDNFHDDRLHEDFFGQDEPEKKIAALLTKHYILENLTSLSPEEIEELEKFRAEQLEQNESVLKKDNIKTISNFCK